jgi:RNA polymerase sigma-70 factor (ECF subfamily)
MADPAVNTIELHRCLERMRAGDKTAQDDLIRGVCTQLETLASKMLRRFPNVNRWAETGDVLQSALLRLFRGLKKLDAPASMPQFFALAAQQMRRELLDLARRHCGPNRPALHHASQVPTDERTMSLEPADAGEEPADLEKWCSFHEEVEKLPAEEREVVGLIYYHGWQQAEVAQLLKITERTVRRRWASAMLKLHDLLTEGDREQAAGEKK